MSEQQEIVVSETPQFEEETVEALADGFLQLQQEMPELESLADLPEAVLQAAAEEHIPLLDAFLRHRFREERAVRLERERQQRAAEAAAGSLQGGGNGADPASAAFARSFEQALQ
jgi:hypothetical protein